MIAADARQSLALERQPTASAAASAAPQSVNELYLTAVNDLENARFPRAVTLLKRVVEIQPTDRAAWSSLGRAYMGLRQTDAAIEAFLILIAIDASDPKPYGALGNAYRTQHQYDVAEAAFRKQLEIDPLAAYGYDGLGRVYLERHQYELAAAQFDKTMALLPQNAAVRVRLGEALLHLDQHDRALAMFARAIELEPTPTTWNNVAYQLALIHTDLELAQRYAESAVAALTAASHAVSIDHVTPRELAQVESLANYWDTLGWVHFARGDIDRAERFVRASWLLAQHAEVGDHLAQIHERRGHREDAIRCYAMALNGERPDSGILQRLVRVAGGIEGAETAVRTHADLLQRERTIPVALDKPAGGTADFFVLFENTADGMRVDTVAFISGDQGLAASADRLRAADFGTVFPDHASAKILRRGTLACTGNEHSSSCKFTFMRPADAVAQQP